MLPDYDNTGDYNKQNNTESIMIYIDTVIATHVFIPSSITSQLLSSSFRISRHYLLGTGGTIVDPIITDHLYYDPEVFLIKQDTRFFISSLNCKFLNTQSMFINSMFFVFSIAFFCFSLFCFFFIQDIVPYENAYINVDIRQNSIIDYR